jgi:hypothetical protein
MKREAVAESAHRSDIGRGAGPGLDLFPQSQNVDVDGTSGDGSTVAPNGVQKLVAAEHGAWPGHQELKELELGGRERYGQLGVRAQAGADLHDVGVREHDVEDDQIGLFTPAQFDGAAEARGTAIFLPRAWPCPQGGRATSGS